MEINEAARTQKGASSQTLATVRETVFARLWGHYRARVPQVLQIEDALRAAGEAWSEDHVAFRTLPGAACGSGVLQRIFESLGYSRQESLHFADKKLDAFWLMPPVAAEGSSAECSPKVFVSELISSHFSPAFQAVVAKYTSRVDHSPADTIAALAHKVTEGEKAGRTDATSWQQLVDACVAYFTSGPVWGSVRSDEYETLRAESEYAAWTLVFGAQANHFTVAVHLMRGFKSLAAFNDHVTGVLGVPMNASGGGLVKGSPAFRLEQSATLAAPVDVMFQDACRSLPYAFVEFAWRFPLEGRVADEKWHSYYQGFVVSNADRIFESTNVR